MAATHPGWCATSCGEVILTPPAVGTLADTVAACCGSDTLAAAAIGIACMTKRPEHFVTWLAYHRDYLGVRRFFVHVEDTPELADEMRRPPWDALVEVSEASGTKRDYVSQVERQAAHVNRAIRLARAAGLTHLLHIDDDELLYCHRGVGALRAELAAATTVSVHLHNLEALYPSAECADPFRETCAFRHRPPAFAAYSNGKSFGALRFSRLAPHGAHTPHAHATAS